MSSLVHLAGPRGELRTGDVVFVHGLNVDLVKSWQVGQSKSLLGWLTSHTEAETWADWLVDDHLSICKPTSKNAIVYLQVSKFIKMVFDPSHHANPDAETEEAKSNTPKPATKDSVPVSSGSVSKVSRGGQSPNIVSGSGPVTINYGKDSDSK